MRIWFGLILKIMVLTKSYILPELCYLTNQSVNARNYNSFRGLSPVVTRLLLTSSSPALLTLLTPSPAPQPSASDQGWTSPAFSDLKTNLSSTRITPIMLSAMRPANGSPDKVNATVGRLNATQCTDVHLICPIAFNLCQRTVDLKSADFGLTYIV